MANLPNCPKCGDEYTYEDGHMFICPMCGNEWTYFICFVNIKLNNNFMLCVMIGEVLWLEFYIYFYC